MKKEMSAKRDAQVFFNKNSYNRFENTTTKFNNYVVNDKSNTQIICSSLQPVLFLNLNKNLKAELYHKNNTFVAYGSRFVEKTFVLFLKKTAYHLFSCDMVVKRQKNQRF